MTLTQKLRCCTGAVPHEAADTIATMTGTLGRLHSYLLLVRRAERQIYGDGRRNETLDTIIADVTMSLALATTDPETKKEND